MWLYLETEPLKRCYPDSNCNKTNFGTPLALHIEAGSIISGSYCIMPIGTLFFFFFFLVFRDRVSLCSPGCPGTYFVDQAGLELRNPPASASQVLGLKACTTTPGSTGTLN
jgi:hypothetical protein